MAVIQLGRLNLRDLRQLGLDGPPRIVDALKLGGFPARLFEIVGKQQIESRLRIAHATRRVQSGNYREAHVGSGKLLIGDTRRGKQCGDAGARSLVHARKAIGYQRAVLGAHGHEIRNGAERGEVGVLAPQVRLAQAPAKHLHELEGDAHAGENGARAVGHALGIGHRHALGHQIGGFMMVGDCQTHAFPLDGLRLVFRRDAAVDRNDEIGRQLFDALERLDRQSVALFEAQRNERRDAAAKIAQPSGKRRGCRDAVEIEIAEHDDVLIRFDARFERIGDVGQARDDVRIEPIALKRRRKELPRSLRRIDSARNKRGGDEMRQAEVLLQ